MAKKKRTPKQTRAIYIGKLGMSEKKFQEYFGSMKTDFKKVWR